MTWKTSSMGFALPADIVLIILTHLHAKDVLNFRKTCREFYGLSKSHSVWEALLRRCIIEDIPLPGLAGRSLDSLDAQELEDLHGRALELRRNWHSESPFIKQSFQFGRPTTATRVVHLEVLPGRDGGRWLVSLAGPGDLTKGTIQCWNLRRGPPVCVAQRVFERFWGMAISKTGNEMDCIAVSTPRGIEILSLVGNATNPNDGFVTSDTITAPMMTLQYFRDRRIITTDSNGRLFLLHIDHPQVKFEFQHSRDKPIDFVLTDTFILILKTQTLELYPLLSSVAAVPRHIIIPPIFVYQWPWPVDSGVMTLRSLVGIKSMNDPITLFIRFGSFRRPWPHNSIYQYEIHPNSYFVSEEPPSELNVPYEYPPVQVGAIAAPVRFLMRSPLTLGVYGTAIWLDNHTEIYYRRSRGQRIAGAYARLERRMQTLDQSNDQVDTAQSGNLENKEASFVFGHQQEESWTSLAIDEEEGVIFLGHRSGVIDMFNYGTWINIA